MKTIINFLPFLLNYYKIRNNPADHISDYDAACHTYDDYYTRHLGSKSLQMLEKVDIREGGTYVDIPCGTGFLTVPLAKKAGSSGKVIAVDLSSGMLSKCKDKVKEHRLDNVTFAYTDAYSYLQAVPSNSLDGVICSWGICYVKNNDFIREISRVLVPGGIAAIIENRSDSLSEIHNLYMTYMMEYPRALKKKITIHLPKNSRYLAKLVKNSNLQVMQNWDGNVEIPCESGYAMIDYLNKAGASSGFLDAVDRGQREEIEGKIIKKLDKLILQNIEPKVIHKYCCVIARK